MVIGQRLKELVAILLIGDGVLAVIAPRRHPRLWLPGPPGYKHTLQALRNRPVLKRFLGIAQVGLGLWLAARQWHS